MTVSTSTNLLPPFPVRRFTVDEYHLMIRLGVLTEDEQVELLEGWIVPKMPRNPPHDFVIDQTNELLSSKLPPAWRIRIQSAITTEDSEPEPDLAIVLGPAKRYVAHHPSPSDIAIVIEVSDSSLAHDREAKGRLYARAGIAAYWIINLVELQVEVYTNPTHSTEVPGYQKRQDYTLSNSVPIVIGKDEIGEISVQELLPTQ